MAIKCHKIYYINGLLWKFFIDIILSYKTMPPVSAKFNENFVGIFIILSHFSIIFLLKPYLSDPRMYAASLGCLNDAVRAQALSAVHLPMHQHRSLVPGPVWFGRMLRRDPSGSSLPWVRAAAPWDEPSCVLRAIQHSKWCTLTRAQPVNWGLAPPAPPGNVWIRIQSRCIESWYIGQYINFGPGTSVICQYANFQSFRPTGGWTSIKHQSANIQIYKELRRK